jgi:polysaccharide export outer membrane protein
LLAACGASLNSDGTTTTLTGPEGLTKPAGEPASGGDTSVAGVATSGQPSGPKTAEAKISVASLPGSGGYKIGAQDVLEVSVFKVPELSKTVSVAETGTVGLPLVGEVKVAGLTAQEVERDLTKKLGAKYLQSPQVTVAVREYNSQRITIDGSVKKPGVIPYRSSISLLQVIASADGLADDSDSTVVIFRTSNGKRSAARFDVSEIRSGTAADPEIKPGDVIVAGSSAVKAAVNNVLKALPLAGLFVGL